MAITQKKSWLGPGAPLTKLCPPRLGNVYVRERLVQQIDAARAQHSVIWIAAPAGAGKTTLVASYLQQREVNALWYQVDSSDQDIASFFYYFGLAAKQSGVRKKLPLFTAEYQLGLPTFTRNWFRGLFAQRSAPAVLVLDNYQEVGDSAALHTVLQHAADELPAGVTLVVISRAQPPAELARLSATNAIAHLGWEHLQLTADESAALVQTLTADASTPTPIGSAALQRLHQRTQGWITGVVLGVRRGLLAAEDHAPPSLTLDTFADRTQLFDYFAAEVLARIDPSTREFLYAAALLPSMTVALCEALTQHRDAKTVLRRLERDSFFTTRRGLLSVSYEFHPLFRQFLLAQGEAHLNTDRLHTLRRSAGQLLAEAGESEHAVALLAATQDWSTVRELVKTQGAELEKQGRLQTLQQWIAALPENERSADPWLLYWSGIAQLPTDPFAAYDLFERAYPQFSASDDVPGLYLCWIGAATALFFRHDDMSPAPGWIAELEQLRVRHPKWPSLELQGRVTTTAVGLLTMGDPQNPALPEWVERAEKIYRYVPMGAVRCFVGYQLAMYYMFFGEVDKLSQIAEDLKPLIDSPKIPDLPRLLAIVASMYSKWHTGNLAAASELIVLGSKLLESSGVYIAAQWLYASAAVINMTHSKIDEATEFVEQLRVQNSPRQRMVLSFIEFIMGWRALLLNDIKTAEGRTASGLQLVEPLHHIFLYVQGLGARTQVLIEAGEFNDAYVLLNQLRKLSEDTSNRLYSGFVCNYLEAYLLERSGGELARVLRALRESFAAASKHKWITMIFWEPRMITRLCTLALQHNIEPDYAKKLIRLYHLTPAETSEPIEHWPYPIKIYTLGRFAIVVDDATLAFEGRTHKKTLDLLKALIACGGREVSEQRLSDALWPDAEADDARNNFKITLHRLRKLLGHDVIQLSESKLTLDPARCWVDVWSLERHLNHITAPTPNRVTRSALLQQGEQALRLYHGAFLHSEEASFVITLRERLRGKLVRAIAHIAEHLQHDQQHEQAQHWYQRGIELEPLVEAFYQGVMRTCQTLQRPAAGLAAYERCHTLLATQLHVAPSPATQALRKALQG